MGTLYELYNFTKKERTDIGTYSVNTKNWMESPLANYYFFMTNQYWSENDDIQLIGDTNGSYEMLNEEFKDITKESLIEYNEIANHYLEYYGDPHEIPKIMTQEEYAMEAQK